MKDSAAEMVNRCFRRQHPEAFGQAEVAEGSVPPELRYGRGDTYTPGPSLAEEPMGDPEAVPL